MPKSNHGSSTRHTGRSQSDIFSQASTSRSQTECSQTQKSQSQGSSQSQNTRKENVVMDELVNDVLLFFLNYNYCIKPVKKSTITKYFKNLGSVKLFNEVLKNVKEILDEDFGLKILEKDNGKTTEYFLTNGLIGEVDFNIEPTCKLEEYKIVLLYLVLLVIYKNGNRLKEEALLEFLKNSSIIKNVKKPIATGYFDDLDVVKFLRQELTGMSYLMCNEIELEDDEKAYEYYWGIRAENEFSVEKLANFFDEVDAIEINAEEDGAEDTTLIEENDYDD